MNFVRQLFFFFAWVPFTVVGFVFAVARQGFIIGYMLAEEMLDNTEA